MKIFHLNYLDCINRMQSFIFQGGIKMKKTNLLLAAVCAATGIGFTTSCGSTNENVLIVGMECNYSPFNWTAIKEDEYTLPISNAKGQYADGYDVQIAKYLGEQLDMEVQIMKFLYFIYFL